MQDTMNLLDAGEWDPNREVCTVLWEDDTIRIEKIVSFGHRTPPENVYCQSEAEWVSVLQGWGKLYFPDTDTEAVLGPGDHMMIPSKMRHLVTYTSKPCIWLCVFEKHRGTADE